MMRMVQRHGWWLFGLCLSAAMFARAEAQTQMQATPVQAMPAAAPQQVQTVRLGVGGGTLVELPGPAATVFAADPKIAEVQPASPTRLFIIGAGRGATTIIATTSSGQPIAEFNVLVGGAAAPGQAGSWGSGGTRVAPELSSTAAINQAIQSMVPGGSGITVSRVGSALALNGTVPTPEAAIQAVSIVHAFAGTDVQLMDQLSVLSSIQVNVQVRVAEVSRTLIRQLGFNWQALGSGSNWQFGLLTGLASQVTNFGVNTAFNQGSQLGGRIGSLTGTNATAVITALAQNNLITTLAEPNLTVESGHSASFLSGGEYPIPVPSAASNEISIEYKTYGVSLAVVPTVLSPNKISMDVEPQVSALDPTHAVTIAGVSVPALTIQKAETTIELGSGESFAIAGLLNNGITQVGTGIPGLSSIPILGALFDTTNFQRSSQELVIIVTPYLVQPVSSPAALQSPTTGFVPATSLEQILFGHELPVNDPGDAPFEPGFVTE